MSTIINGTTDAITFPDGTIQNTSAIVSGKVPYTNLPAGTILQVLSTTTTTLQTSTSGSVIDITGLSVSITPKFSTSKIFVSVSVSGSATNALLLFLFRNSTAIDLGSGGSGYNPTVGLVAGVGNYMYPIGTTYIDSPATTSATTYKMGAACDTGTFAINRRQSASDIAGTSTITVMEIAQ